MCFESSSANIKYPISIGIKFALKKFFIPPRKLFVGGYTVFMLSICDILVFQYLEKAIGRIS